MANRLERTPTGLYKISDVHTGNPPRSSSEKSLRGRVKPLPVARVGSPSPVPIPRGHSRGPSYAQPTQASAGRARQSSDSPPNETKTPPAPASMAPVARRAKTFSGRISKPPEKATVAVAESVPSTMNSRRARGDWRSRPIVSEATYAPPPDVAESRPASPVVNVQTRLLPPPSSLPDEAETEDQMRARLLREADERRNQLAEQIANRLAAQQRIMAQAREQARGDEEKKQPDPRMFVLTTSRRASLSERCKPDYMPKGVTVSAAAAAMMRETLERVNSGDLEEPGLLEPELSVALTTEEPTVCSSVMEAPVLLTPGEPLEAYCTGMEDLFAPPSESGTEADEAFQTPLPPEFEEAEDLFSMRWIQAHCPKELVPPPSVIAANAEQWPRFTGLSWTGWVKDASVSEFVVHFPNVTRIRLCCDGLTDVGIFALRRYTKTEILFLGKLPHATQKTMRLLFSPAPQVEKPWQNLKQLYLAGLPVTNKTLEKIAELPQLETIDLSFCENISWQGLRSLLQCRSLRSIRVQGCRRIDSFACDEFHRARPDVTIEGDEPTCDPELNAMAITEAKFSDGPNAPRYYAFLADRLIPESELAGLTLDETDVSAAYTRNLAGFGIELAQLEITEMKREHWMKADQILQALKNITRTFHAIVAYLKDESMGYYTDQDQGNNKMVEPTTVEQLITHLRRPPILSLPKREEKEEQSSEELRDSLQKSGRFDPPPAHKMKILPFANLGITWIPSYVLQTKFTRVTDIELEGNAAIIPPAFRTQLPLLGKRERVASPKPGQQNPPVAAATPPPQPPKGLATRLMGLFKKE